MKRQDITLIIMVVFLSSVISIIVANLFITSPDNRQEKVETVQPISADFNQPDKRFFNENSIDPTLLIRIGDDGNDHPFNRQ